MRAHSLIYVFNISSILDTNTFQWDTSVKDRKKEILIDKEECEDYVNRKAHQNGESKIYEYCGLR